MVVEISLVVIAVCFVLLFVCALILTINALGTLKKVNKLVELDVGLLVEEATQTVHSVKEITRSLKDKVECAAPLFHSVNRTTQADLNPKETKLNFGDWAELAGQGLLMWQKIKQRNR